MKQQSVYIAYGIFGGKVTARRLRKALRHAGYHLENNIDKAEFIIGHSAGCFWLENTSPHQNLMLVNPPYWPGKSIKQRTHDRKRQNFQYKAAGIRTSEWLNRNLLGAYYAIRDARRTWRIMRVGPTYDLTATLADHPHVLIVRNQSDIWLTPDLAELQQKYPHIKIKELPGDHDDILYHPEPYVNLLQSELAKES